MERYTITLSINGMVGAFARKYSVTIKDAQYLNVLLQARAKPDIPGDFTLLAPRTENVFVDPMPLFPAAMKLLRWAARDKADRPYYTGVRELPDAAEPGPWMELITTEDNDASLMLYGIGPRAKVLRQVGDEDPVFEKLPRAPEPTLSTSTTTYQWRSSTWRELFKVDLEGLIVMFEESMAKGEDLIATTHFAQNGDFS